MTRLETFTDAAFAFAVTLLVVSIDAVPTNYALLVKAMQDIPAFLISFLLLMMFWYGHWQWSRRYGIEDLPSIWLSGGLVFVVLCYVYPLKYIFSVFLNYLSGGFLSPDASVSGPAEIYQSLAIYSCGYVAMSGVMLLLNLHAWRHRKALSLTPPELFDTRAEIGVWIIMVAIGLVSAFLALFTTPHRLVPPGNVYMLLAVVMPLYGVLTGRRREKLFEPREEKKVTPPKTPDKPGANPEE